MMTMMMIMLHIYKVTYVNQAIYIYENSLIYAPRNGPVRWEGQGLLASF